MIQALGQISLTAKIQDSMGFYIAQRSVIMAIWLFVPPSGVRKSTSSSYLQ